jgi:acyl-CoA hydrolase
MSPRVINLGELLDHFQPGRKIYIPGAAGELGFLRDALAREPDRLRGVHLLSCLLPGINAFDYAGLDPTARLTTFLLSPALRPSFEEGRTQILPLSYSGVARYLATAAPDVAILHLTPATGGHHGFGICADFGPIVAAKAKIRIGVVNAAMPCPALGPTWSAEALDAVFHIDETPAIGIDSRPAAELETIAHGVATLVPDGSTIQTGIGQAPATIWAALCERRDLRLFSGVVTNGFVQAWKAGALAPDGHVAGIAYGDEGLYDLLNGSEAVRFADVRTTHGAALAEIERLITINSALEVDLFGQANLEWIGDRLVSGVGGAPEFSRAGRMSLGGRSILALPATARKGQKSRIVARLTTPTVSLGRDLTDTIVTEHGIAEIGDLSLDSRAERLIAVAAPEHRDELGRAWAALRSQV